MRGNKLTKKELIDILEAQKAYINELLTKAESEVIYIPPVIENGVMKKLGRTIYKSI